MSVVTYLLQGDVTGWKDYVKYASNTVTSVLGSKNVSGVHRVAPDCILYPRKNVTTFYTIGNYNNNKSPITILFGIVSTQSVHH